MYITNLIINQHKPDNRKQPAHCTDTAVLSARARLNLFW